MIGWILAGIAGAAILSSSSDNDSLTISTSDKHCACCHDSSDTSWSVTYRGTDTFTVRFYCSYCNRAWYKKYYY